MSTESNNKNLKITVGVLIALVALLGIFTLKFYYQGEDTKNQLTNEKEQVLMELNEIKVNYDKALQENTVIDDELKAARDRIEKLIDSVETMEADIAVLSRYRQEVFKLKKERESLLRLNDSLQNVNYTLNVALDSTSTQLASNIKLSDSLSVKNTELSKMVEVASELNVLNLQTVGQIIRSNGKTVETDRARRTDKLSVCFTLAENKIATPGTREYYVQIIDPKNNLIGTKNAIEYGEATLYYSTTVAVEYKNKNTDVCVDVANPNSDTKFEKGLYVANIFDGPQLVSSKTFELK
ncbi:MAG: hypothetical protein KKC03_10270 [Bacteroidetes bacterium]|nr:hypothetical protein [Bacteroidota bacterium]